MSARSSSRPRKVPAGRPRALVFDLDGTLLDSMPMVRRAFMFAVAPWARWEDGEHYRRQLGGTYQTCLRNLLPPGQDILPAVDRLIDYNRRHEADIAPFAGAVEFLEAMRAAGVPLTIWTSRDRMSTGRLLGRWKLERFFDPIVCGDDFASHKPDPEPLRHLTGRLGAPGGEVLFAGDSEVDVLAGYAAGVPTLLIRQGHGFSAEVLAKAHHVVDTAGEAYTWMHARFTG